jgi:hypothetical protein
MNLLSFKDFLNESEASITGREFVDEFVEICKTTFSSVQAVEDVWCMPKDLFDAYRKDKAPGIELLKRAEAYESEQRRLPLNSRLESPYFLIEFRIGRYGSNTHIYRVVGIDMESKEIVNEDSWYFRRIGSLEDEMEKIFDALLKRYYPTLSTSRKYGL